MKFRCTIQPPDLQTLSLSLGWTLIMRYRLSNMVGLPAVSTPQCNLLCFILTLLQLNDRLPISFTTTQIPLEFKGFCLFELHCFSFHYCLVSSVTLYSHLLINFWLFNSTFLYSIPHCQYPSYLIISAHTVSAG